MRVRPSFSCGASAASAASARAPPVVEFGDDTHLMAALGLSAGEIEHVAEQAAHGGAHHVNDSERAVRRGRHLRTIVRR